MSELDAPREVPEPSAGELGGAAGEGPEREPKTSLALYHLLKWPIVHPIFRWYLGGRFYGSDQVPRTGPLVVVSNHASDFDPPIISYCVRRPVAYMAKEELFRVPAFARVISAYGAYPVKRGAADRSAIRAAMARLQEGWAVGVFLQGNRTADGRVPDPKLGAALIAHKAQAPILPVCLWGTQAIRQQGSLLSTRPHPVTVRIGAPIAAPGSHRREELEAVTRQCVDAIHAMHDQGR